MDTLPHIYPFLSVIKTQRTVAKRVLTKTETKDMPPTQNSAILLAIRLRKGNNLTKPPCIANFTEKLHTKLVY